MTESWTDQRLWLSTGCRGHLRGTKRMYDGQSFMRTQPTEQLLNIHYVFIVSVQNPLCKQTYIYLKLSVTTDSPITSLM